MKYYYDKIQEMRDSIIQEFGSDLYQIAEAGVKAWKAASEQGKVTRGLWIAEKI